MRRVSVFILGAAVLLGATGQMEAKPVLSITATGSTLNSFTDMDGNTFTQSDLIQGNLTAWSGSNDFNTVIAPGGTFPAPGSRSLLLTGDFSLTTGVVNAATSATAATLTFPGGLINAAGPDLVFFESEGTGDTIRDDVSVEINGTTLVIGGTEYGLSVLTQSDPHGHSRSGTGTLNITNLETDPHVLETPERFHSSDSEIYGFTIDLSDFGVGPLASITNVNFGDGPGSGQLDPVLFMGIGTASSAAVLEPEPSTILLWTLMALGGGAFAYWRRRRRAVG